MDFNDSQQEAEFRKEAREFLEENAEKRSVISDKPNDKSPQIAVAGAPETVCLLYTSPSPRDGLLSRMPSSA